MCIVLLLPSSVYNQELVYSNNSLVYCLPLESTLKEWIEWAIRNYRNYHHDYEKMTLNRIDQEKLYKNNRIEPIAYSFLQELTRKEQFSNVLYKVMPFVVSDLGEFISSFMNSLVGIRNPTCAKWYVEQADTDVCVISNNIITKKVGENEDFLPLLVLKSGPRCHDNIDLVIEAYKLIKRKKIDYFKLLDSDDYFHILKEQNIYLIIPKKPLQLHERGKYRLNFNIGEVSDHIDISVR